MEFGKNLCGKHISHEGEFRSSRFRFSGLGSGVVRGRAGPRAGGGWVGWGAGRARSSDEVVAPAGGAA